MDAFIVQTRIIWKFQIEWLVSTCYVFFLKIIFDNKISKPQRSKQSILKLHKLKSSESGSWENYTEQLRVNPFKTATFWKMQLRKFFNMFFHIKNNSDQFWSHFNSINRSGDNFWVTSDPIILKGHIIEIF